MKKCFLFHFFRECFYFDQIKPSYVFSFLLSLFLKIYSVNLTYVLKNENFLLLRIICSSSVSCCGFGLFNGITLYNNKDTANIVVNFYLIVHNKKQYLIACSFDLALKHNNNRQNHQAFSMTARNL